LYKEFSIFLLLTITILIPNDAFAGTEDDQKIKLNEPKKDQMNIESFEISFQGYFNYNTEYYPEIELVDTHLLYEPYSKWIDDN